ncbi:MAG: glutamine synthetase family protein [Thermomicrobiales bacterium]
MSGTELMEGVLRAARAAQLAAVRLQYSAVTGALKDILLPVTRLRDALAIGVWFDGSSVEGAAREAEMDLLLRPDPTTFAVLPLPGGTTDARLLCDLTTVAGEPFAADSRAVLRRALAAAADFGLTMRASAELEFYLLRDDERQTPLDRVGYFDVAASAAAALCRDTVAILGQTGYRPRSAHHETGAGQYELAFGLDEPLRLADGICTAITVIHALAEQRGLVASFRPRPLRDQSGSGLHLGLALADQATGQPALFDAGASGTLSLVGEQFVAGILTQARPLCAVLAPSPDSYRRLHEGAEAPARADWARVSHGAFVRVPHSAGQHTPIIEARAADPTCNPYLALAALLASGLDGVRSGAALPPPADHLPGQPPAVNVLAGPLPVTLGEALEELTWSPVVRAALGQPVYERFIAEKEREWAAERRWLAMRED